MSYKTVPKTGVVVLARKGQHFSLFVGGRFIGGSKTESSSIHSLSLRGIPVSDIKWLEVHFPDPKKPEQYYTEYERKNNIRYDLVLDCGSVQFVGEFPEGTTDYKKYIAQTNPCYTGMTVKIYSDEIDDFEI